MMSSLTKLCVLAVMITMSINAHPQDPIVGAHVSVIDGDTIIIQGAHFRLFGIDAPEFEQPCLGGDLRIYRCGEEAWLYLASMLAGGKVECWAESKDLYGRIVGTCTINGKDVGDAMVRAGWALDWPLYSHGQYAAAEAEAKKEKRGIWKGMFDLPWVWRRMKEKEREQ